MSTSIKTSLLILLAATALIVAAFVAVPSAQAGHSWSGYHWARTTPSFTLKLGDNVNGAWDASLATSSIAWSVSAVLDTTVVAGATTPRNCRATSGTVQVCNSTYGNNRWLGLAQIWISGSHITQGVAKLNDTYFNRAPYNTTAWRNLVMCQEVGHTFGLNHQDEVFGNYNLGTCMDYTNAPAGGVVGGFNYGPNNERPNPHDDAQLGLIYSHLDTSTTISSSVTARGASALAQSGNFENASEWGKEIRRDSRSNGSLYERDLGNGNKVFTFVIWADGAPSAPAGHVAPSTPLVPFVYGGGVGIGSRGTDTTELQKILIAEGFLQIPAPVGTFGPLTLAAVKAYQKAHGISPQSGYVGPLTRAVLNNGTTPMSDAQSIEIEGLQAQLAALMAQLDTLSGR